MATTKNEANSAQGGVKTAKATTYYQQSANKKIEALERLLVDLPEFCAEFFIGIDNSTEASTKLAYARDLATFFDFLVKNIRKFSGKNIFDFTLSDLNAVTVENLEMYVAKLKLYVYKGKKLNNDESTKSRKLSAVRSLFKYFYNKEKLSQNVASKIVMPKLHEKPIVRMTGDEVGELLGTMETEDKFVSLRQNAYNMNTQARDIAIFTLFLGTGIRISELVGINMNDIDLVNKRFVVTRKGGNTAYLFFGDEVRDALEIYIEWRFARLMKAEVEEDALFISLQNKRITDRAVQNLVKKMSSLVCGIKKITPHKLRSTFGTELYKATKDIYVVAETLGHKDINTTKKHYAATSEDIKRAAAETVVLRKKG